MTGDAARLPGILLLMVLLLLLAHRGPVPVAVGRWVDSYLDDLLFLPLVLGGVLTAMRLARRRRAWTVPLPLALVSLVIYATYFEAVLPRFSSRATGDFRDVLAYAAGFMLFMTALNRPARARPGQRPLDELAVEDRFLG